MMFKQKKWQTIQFKDTNSKNNYPNNNLYLIAKVILTQKWLLSLSKEYQLKIMTKKKKQFKMIIKTKNKLKKSKKMNKLKSKTNWRKLSLNLNKSFLLRQSNNLNFIIRKNILNLKKVKLDPIKSESIREDFSE